MPRAGIFAQGRADIDRSPCGGGRLEGQPEGTVSMGAYGVTPVSASEKSNMSKVHRCFEGRSWIVDPAPTIAI